MDTSTKIKQAKSKTSGSPIPFSKEWSQRKAEANTHIAGAIQHFASKEKIDKRTYFITAHKEIRSKYFKRSGSSEAPRPISNKSFHLSLYKEITNIFSATYRGEIDKLSLQEKPGMIICTDVGGTKSRSNWGNFDTNNSPHIHALLILPFEITDPRTDLAFMHKVKEVIEGIDGVKRSNIAGQNPSVEVRKFIPNRPLWWLVDYATKARHFTYADPDFAPSVFPFDLALDKNDPTKGRDEFEQERLQRKRNNILSDSFRCYRSLTYDPRSFYESDICCDFSVRHKAFLAQKKLTESESYTPTDHDIDQIVSWRGKFDNSICGNEVPISTKNSSKPGNIFVAVKPSGWGVSLSGYLDESACCAALGKEVLPPNGVQTVFLPQEFFHSPSPHAWLKTQVYFQQRLLFWRLHFSILRLARFQQIYR